MTTRKIRKGSEIAVYDAAGGALVGIVTDVDDHGVAIDNGVEYYFPWSGISRIRIDSTPEQKERERTGTVL